MIPVVSNKYKYVFFYNPKSACSVARKLFLDLHREELSPQRQAELAALRAQNQDEWHSLDQLFPYQSDRNYDDYFKFSLVRHPTMRLVSAYLNRVVLKMTDQAKIEAKLKRHFGESFEVTHSFEQFLQYLSVATVDEQDNPHFQPQSYLQPPLQDHRIRTYLRAPIAKLFARLKQWVGWQDSAVVGLDAVCKVESLQQDLLDVYAKIFRHHPEKMSEVRRFVGHLPIHNATFSSDQEWPAAHKISADELRSKGQMPKYQSFLARDCLSQIASIYAADFELFDYSVSPSEEVARFERQKHRDIRSYVPADFDWQGYIDNNPDLPLNGIDNKADAINHWIHHGRFEDRTFR